MDNIKIELDKLIDIIQKDTGINNTMDAIEQLSGILLLKYCYEFNLYKEKNTDDFKKLFYSKEKNIIDFSKFTNILKNIFITNENYFSEDETFKKIENILSNIPFRIKSAKILEILLLKIEMIDFNDNLAEAYDKLLEKMINESTASGAFHSPKALVSSIIKVIQPSIDQSIYDPALGTGRFIIEAQKNFLASSKPNTTQKLLKIYGQDISSFAYLVGSLNLLLNNIQIKGISLGDSLLNSNDCKYDIILSAIPFGKISNIEKYKYNYKEYASNLETMFLILTMKKLAKGGKAALIVPDGLLSNSGKRVLSIRKELLNTFNLHSILSLPIGILSPYSGVKMSVLFFDNTQIENNIWFYELKTDNTLNRTNQIKEQDFKEFIELFPKRVKSKNSSIIKKEDVLSDKILNLDLKFSIQTDNKNSFDMSNETLLIEEINKKYNELLFKFTNLILENKKINFVKEITLGELFTIKSGKPLTKDKIKKEGKYPVYGGNGIMGYYEEYNLENENIIIGRVGAYCGNIHFTKESIWITNNSFSIQLNSTQVHLPYLAHLLRSLELNRLARGAGQPSISYSKIKDIQISLPSFEQQKELADWFDKIQIENEKLINLCELQKNKLKSLSNYSIVTNCIESYS